MVLLVRKDKLEERLVNMSRELVFSITSSDFNFTATKGSGKGGQKRNKTSSAVYCTHPPSGSQGYSDETRSQHQNKVSAWKKCISTPKFKNWHKLEIARRTGKELEIKEKVERELKYNVKVEVVEDGKWIEEKELI